MSGSLANLFAKEANEGQGRGAFLPNHTPFFGGIDGDMEAKAREFAAAVAFAAGGMPSPPGLLRVAPNSLSASHTYRTCM